MQDINIQHLKVFIEKDVRSFIAENLTFSDDPDELDAEASMIETDIIDSTSILELVSYLEERFEIEIDDSDVVPENFDTLNRMVSYIERQLTGQSVDLELLRKVS